MIRLHGARASAERFDSLVGGEPSGRHDSLDPRTAELLELVGALRSVPSPQARPEFVADLREQLMTAARTELAPGAASERSAAELTDRLTLPQRRTRHERRLSVALGAVAIVGATTSMAVASQSALPGDALYPLKRAIENTEAGFSVGDDAKGAALLDNASGRLDEVEALTQRDDADAGLVEDALNTFSDQASEASDLLISDYEQTGQASSIAEVRDFTAQSMTMLGELEDVIPAAAEDALLNAAQVLFTIDAAAAQVCPECGGAGVSEIPPTLVASGTSEIDDAVTALAGAALEPSPAGNPQFQPDGPSAVDPPEDPVNIPAQPAPEADDEAPSGGLGDLPSSGVSIGGQGQSGNQGGGKGKPKPVDLSPVTGAVQETVDEVVSGVVEGVTDVLGGLTGQAGLGGPGGQQQP